MLQLSPPVLALSAENAWYYDPPSADLPFPEARVSSKLSLISNGNRTEWSPIRSVIIRVITKSDDRAAGDRFVY